MKKQELLDIENPNQEEWILIQILSQMNKTEIITLERLLRRYKSVAYKSYAHNIPISLVYYHILTAKQLNETENPKPNDKVEDNNQA